MDVPPVWDTDPPETISLYNVWSALRDFISIAGIVFPVVRAALNALTRQNASVVRVIWRSEIKEGACAMAFI